MEEYLHELVELWRYTSELSSSRNIRRKTNGK
nr:MAG TPA: hypothetical protein [Caudoviricetes sp.]